MFVLQLFSVHRKGMPVVRNVSLSLPSPGLLFVVGSGGAGKSSLLAALAGTGAGADVCHAGCAELNGVLVHGGATASTWVPQHVQLAGEATVAQQLGPMLGMSSEALATWLRGHAADVVDVEPDAPCNDLSRSQRRMLAVLARLHREVPLILADEPGADMDDVHAACVRRRLHALSSQSMVVVATHNRQECLALGGHTALLAGGRIQEIAPTDRFFSEPTTDAARTYVDTGNCNLPAERGSVQNGIWWVVPGLLCGMSRPGVMASAEFQYTTLHHRGVRWLVCLEETCRYPATVAREHGIAHLHIPVPDMAPPSFNQAVDLCRSAEQPIRNNEGMALHCRGGLGRTGTGLALILVWFGDSADAAIAKVRRANPLAIQSDVQLRFIHEFAHRIRGWHLPGNTYEEKLNVVG